MAKWILKATLQKAMSLLPDGHKINYVFQKHVTKMRLDDALMDQALVHCADHLRHLGASGNGALGPATLELGTGWYAVVPIGLFLCGARSVTTVDLTPLLRAENLVITLKKFSEYDARGRLAEFHPAADPSRLARVRALAENAESSSVEELLRALEIRYLVVDARRLELPDAGIDLIHSNDVFEHIYPNVLAEILREFKRLSASGGTMSHFIDMSDHFSHFDPSIGVYHFLRYTDAQWKVIDNSIAPQSRLRLTEYRALYARLGIAIAEEKHRPGSLDELSGIPLASRFRTMPESEVAVTHAYFITKT